MYKTLSYLFYSLGFLYLVFANFYNAEHFNRSAGFWDFMFAFLVFGGLGRAFRNKHKSQEQQKKDAEIQSDLKEGLLEKGYKEYSLYLRPFDITNKVSMKRGDKKWYWNNIVDQDYELSFEEAIEKDFSNFGMPLIGLGRPGEAIGIARIETLDESWQDLVRPLIEGAKTILIIPAINEGTYWEVSHIINNKLLNKAAFIMPPTQHPSKQSEAAWEEIEKKYKSDFNVQIPKYSKQGVAFTLSPSEDESYVLNHTDLPKKYEKGSLIGVIRSLINLSEN